MILVFDTSALSKILDGNKELISVATQPQFDSYLLPLSADTELRFGFKHGNRELANLDNFYHIKKTYGLEPACPNQETGLIYADIATYCRSMGLSLSDNDIWIASAAVQCGGTLLTTDNDFTALPQVRLASL